jgi:outer membrane translocation and assembly module TamA
VTFDRVEGDLDTSGSEQLFWVDQQLAYDRRDDPLDARRGFYAEVRAEEGNGWIQVTPEARGYVPLGRRWVLAARLRGGRTLSGESPLTRRYFSGGGTSHRGFAFRRLAPWVETTEGERAPVGGQALVETSVEARIELLKVRGRWLGTVLFLDGGDVTERASELSATNLHWAAGTGLRYDTPVGDLRLDFGWRLNRVTQADPDPDRRWALHFSLGEAF